MSCKNYHVRTCDCDISWEDLLGDPSNNKQLKNAVDGWIKDALAGQTPSDVDIKDLVDKVNDAIKEDIAELVDLDAYKVKYLTTTVGDALDNLFNIKFDGFVLSHDFEIGDRRLNHKVQWYFNKELQSQTLTIKRTDMDIQTIELEPDIREYEDPEVTEDTDYIITAKDTFGNDLVITGSAKFYLRYYWGANPSKRIKNTEILALNSELAKPDVYKYNMKFNCRGGKYMWYIFPEPLHNYYSIFTNNIMDTDFTYEVKNVTNRFGYISRYLYIKSNNLQTALDIYAEVIAHE